MAQIVCRDASLGYDGEIVTKNISFEVNSGDYLCIVGENGSGKSTLIKAILQLIKPVSGSVEICGGLTPSQIGYLPQQTEIQQDFPAFVREVVISGCSAAKRGIFFGKAAKSLAESNMRRMGIEQLAGKSLRDLSGGQRQRVFLARALCAAKDILLLDEPVAGLDPKVTAELYEILAELNRLDKMTVVMVSHDISAALRYATHILHIGDRQLFFGTAEEYRASDIGKMFARTEGEV